MALTPEYLDHVLTLAHLDVPEDKKLHFKEQLEGILEHTKDLAKFNFENIDPTLTLSLDETPLREDVVVPHEPMDLSLNAPQFEDGCFVVPKIK